MEKIPLDIVALSHNVTHSQNYAVVLGESHGRRRLPIVIGAFEAQAIAVAMEGMVPSRPLSHDLFKSAMDTFGIVVREVVINNLLDGVFHARLICELNGDVVEIDSRTSDALAMAVRCRCPIYTYEFILEAAGLEVEDTEEGAEETKPTPKKRTRRKSSSSTSYGEKSLDELTELLEQVIGEEDYEKAAKIRDELNRRKESSDPTESPAE